MSLSVLKFCFCFFSVCPYPLPYISLVLSTQCFLMDNAKRKRKRMEVKSYWYSLCEAKERKNAKCFWSNVNVKRLLTDWSVATIGRKTSGLNARSSNTQLLHSMLPTYALNVTYIQCYPHLHWMLPTFNVSYIQCYLHSMFLHSMLPTSTFNVTYFQCYLHGQNGQLSPMVVTPASFVKGL